MSNKLKFIVELADWMCYSCDRADWMYQLSIKVRGDNIMFFKIKGKRVHNESSLGIYSAKENEPRSSVMESSDYDFAVQKYTKSDFRFRFVHEYINYIKLTYGVEIFNCKFELPQSDCNFLNFYIYLWEDDPTIQYRIEDANNHFIMAFYKILKDYPLPAVTEQLRLQFLIKNIYHVMHGRVLKLTWEDIHLRIKDLFPQIADISYWLVFYVFIKKEEFQVIIENTLQLNQIKEYCYKMSKIHDINNILCFEQFQIRIDNYDNYQLIGGYNYFNSDYMFNCLLF